MDFDDLEAEPEGQIVRWLETARQSGEVLPEAMALATATPEGRPSVRMVLLRGIGNGLVFFSDADSDKGADLRVNPRAAVVLHWRVPEHRQVRVNGPTETVDPAEADAYWRTRQPEARITAAASPQSGVIASRAVLEERIAETARRYGSRDVPRPERWGGWRITPEVVEFWEERPGRAHDRLRYRRQGGVWITERLSP